MQYAVCSKLAPLYLMGQHFWHVITAELATPILEVKPLNCCELLFPTNFGVRPADTKTWSCDQVRTIIVPSSMCQNAFPGTLEALHIPKMHLFEHHLNGITLLNLMCTVLLI